MESGFSKRKGLFLLLLCCMTLALAENQVSVTPLTHDIQDLSQRSSKVYDQNGERCALIKFETPIPGFFSFNLGAQQIEKRENKDDEVWIWVSPDVKKMTIRCSDCTPLKDYRVSLKAGNVYRAKITTGLPQETATTQKVSIYCERTPFTVSIDGAAPVESHIRTYYTELPIGAHDLVVASKYYKPYSGTIRVFRSKPYSDTIRMENNYGEVYVSCTPGGYSVNVDGEEQVQTRVIRLEPGMHKITVFKERYEPYETTVDVQVNGQHPVNASLVPAFATFTISTSDEETEIWVDGRRRGRNRVNVEITWGEHKIEGRREGYDPWEYAMTDFTPNSVRTIKIPKLNKQYGGVRLSFYPPTAMVYVDGQPVSMSNGLYLDTKMSTGTHYVQARLEDYASVRDSFTVVSGNIFTGDYTLQPLAMGWATITTDPEIAIYRTTADNNLLFLGHTTYQGKLPAGENIIILKNGAGASCQYSLFINNKEEHAPVTFPFMRKLMVRTNVGRDITIKGEKRPPYGIKPNVNVRVEPMKYEINIRKSGYQPYRDTIDLSVAGLKNYIYRAELRKLGDTVTHYKRLNKYPQRFYDLAGTWYIGVIDFGYTFDFKGNLADTTRGFKHVITAGILPFRYKMFGMSLLDFELCVNDTAVLRSFCYKPKVSLYVPCSDGFAFHFYAGASINLYDAFHKPEQNAAPTPIRAYLIGGAAFRFNYVGKFPMDIFAEYKYPIHGVAPEMIGERSQLFRVGVSFSIGVDH